MAANDPHGRARSLLRAQRLITLREGVSPLNLVLDSLEQKAQPLLSAYKARAKVNKDKVVLLSFTTLRKPQDVDGFVKAAGRNLALVRKELLDVYQSLQQELRRGIKVIIDSLNSLISADPNSLTSFLSSIITPGVSVIAVYHTDVLAILPKSFNEYEPHPFAVASHLATAILKVTSLQQEIERQEARDRALVEPEWGLKEGREGVVVGLRGKGKPADRAGIVVDVEERTKSGKTIVDKFYILPSEKASGLPRMMMLSEHPVFAPPEEQGGEEEPESTFDLSLTEKQKRDREGIVLPYFDAQKDVGGGEGGRILYEMGREDDFDDEEDEI